MMRALNPHQFGDQKTLFDAPLGQPQQGIFKGNPHATLYRSVGVPASTLRDTRETGDIGYVSDHVGRPGKDSGVDRSLGLHWQHDLEQAKTHTWGPGARVVIEADHPGLDHVMDPDKDKDVIDKTVTGVPGYRATHVLPEVPVRPGAPVNVRAIHVPAPNAEQPQEYHRGNDSARVWVRHPVNMKGRA